MLSIARVCIDAGYLTNQVQEFCRKQGAHVIPIIGRAGQGKSVVPTYTKRLDRLRKPYKKRGVSEVIGVDDGKLNVFRSLALPPGGPQSCHFPMDRDEEYFLQLTAEKLVISYKRGRPYMEWVKTRTRNEAFDCRVYAYAAMLFVGAAKIKEIAPPDTVPTPKRTPPARRAPARPMIR